MIRVMKPEVGPICGVFAITMTTPDVPFCMVKGMAQEEMQKRRWTGPMHMPAMKGLLSRLSVGFEEHGHLTGQVLRDAHSALDPNKHYILFVTGHFLTVHDGKGYDQGNAHGTPIEQFWCLGRKIITVLEITKFAPSYDELFPDEDE